VSTRIEGCKGESRCTTKKGQGNLHLH
jgi:hypothetical protein